MISRRGRTLSGSCCRSGCFGWWWLSGAVGDRGGVRRGRCGAGGGGCRCGAVGGGAVAPVAGECRVVRRGRHPLGGGGFVASGGRVLAVSSSGPAFTNTSCERALSVPVVVTLDRVRAMCLHSTLSGVVPGTTTRESERTCLIIPE